MGHCQACGNLQLLPHGLLSTHGYTVAEGFFHGTCRGAKELPLELSCDLIRKFIGEAQRELAGVAMFMARLRTPATKPTAWVQNYETINKKGKSGYRWRDVVVECETRSHPANTTYNEYYYMAPGTFGAMNQRHKINTVYRGFDMANDPEIGSVQLANNMNGVYADWLDRVTAARLRRYIAWQESRVAAWLPDNVMPVTWSGPVKHDGQGFVLEPKGA